MSVNRDKQTELNVLRYLMSDLRYIKRTDKYILTPDDFSTRQNKIMFLALSVLADQGCQVATTTNIMQVAADNDLFAAIDKDSYLGMFAEMQVNGISEESFDYSYNKLKKINLLNALDKEGFKTDEFLVSDDNITIMDSDKINSQFDSLTPSDIIVSYRNKLTKLENKFLVLSENSTVDACDNLEDLIASFGTQDDIGLHIQGDLQNRVLNGARFGTLTIRSASSGAGKTRLAVADAAYLAYPIRWEDGAWKINGHNEPVLFVATEQTADEIKRMILAYLTGIQENQFRYGNLTTEQRERVNIAAKIMKKYKDNFKLARIPEPSVEIIKNKLKDDIRQYGSKYVFFDYISVSPKLYKEFGGSSLRTDEALLLMTTALKDVAVEMNVAIFSATQLNASGDNNGSNNIKNEASLAGARSIINKADNGLIMMRLTEEQSQKAQDMNLSYKGELPNRIFDVYKVRSGDYSQVRIYSYFDMGTLRCHDIITLDSMGNPIQMDMFDNFEQLTNEDLNECKRWIEGGFND